jgi:hypothetical protein
VAVEVRDKDSRPLIKAVMIFEVDILTSDCPSSSSALSRNRSLPIPPSATLLPQKSR